MSLTFDKIGLISLFPSILTLAFHLHLSHPLFHPSFFSAQVRSPYSLLYMLKLPQNIRMHPNRQVYLLTLSVSNLFSNPVSPPAKGGLHGRSRLIFLEALTCLLCKFEW